MNKRLLLVIKLLVSALILALLIYKIDYRLLVENIKLLPFIAVVLLATNYFATVLLNSLALFTFIRKANNKIKVLQFLKCNWFAFSLGQFSPARSGEVGIIYLLKKKYNTVIGKSSASFLMYKLSTLLTLFVFAFIMLFTYFSFLYKWYLLALLVLALIISGFVMMQNYRIRILIRKYILGKYASIMTGFHDEIKALAKDKFHFLVVMVINALKLSYNAFIVMLVLSILGIQAPFLLIIGINAITLITTLVPISFAGIGIKESVAVFLFYTAGFDPAIIAAIYIVITGLYIIFNSISLTYFVNMTDYSRKGNSEDFSQKGLLTTSR